MRGVTLNRTNLAAFDATTGQVSDSFNPVVNAPVQKVLAAPDGTSIFVGGGFTQLNGVASSHLVKLSVATGLAVSGFTGTVKGTVQSMDLVGQRLFFAGGFSTVNGKASQNVAEINATTGKTTIVDTPVIAGTHHGDGSTGVTTLDASADGQHLLITGNFGTVDGAVHSQVAEFSVTPTGIAVDAWHSPLFDANSCSSHYAYWVQDAQFSPDSSYFVVDGTGAYGNGTAGLCDSASRWNVDPTNTNATPAWVEYNGGDSDTAVQITDTAVYIGGHYRWQNNPFCGDCAGQGAIDFRGLAALDPVNGLPMAWDPGGVEQLGYYDILPTDKGIFTGSDFLVTGNATHKGIAFFPLASGHTPPASTVPNLPANIIRLGRPATAANSGILYRVNAAGPALPAIDNGPDWAADNSDPSSYRPNGSNIATYTAVPNVNPVVPSSTPIGIFSQERWYPDDTSGHWSFPVAAGTHVQVRLYFANRYSGTSQAGQRVFNVNVDGQAFLNHYDIVADTGDQTGTMKSINVTSPGAITIDLQHVNENPLINGIELVNTDVTPPAASDADTASSESYNGSTFGASSDLPSSGIPWSTARGAFDINGNAYVAMANGTLTKQTFDGTNFGTPSVVNLNGLTNFASEMQQMTGMFYLNGHVYYTQAGSSQLLSRGFEPDSDVVGALEFVTANNLSDINWANVAGMFYAGGNLYWLDRTTGDLMRSTWSANGPVAGTAVAVSGPGVDSQVWNTRALFTVPKPNQPPVAVPNVTCTGMTCSADGSTSSDPDGTVAAYNWQFGDSGTASGATASHTYTTAGTYTVTLTVTDNQGAVGSATQQVTVAPLASPISFLGSSHSTNVAYAKSFTATVPTSVQAGDGLLLYGSVDAGTTGGTISAPAGWTLVKSATTTANDTQASIWSKVATAADAGSTVTLSSTKSVKATMELLAYHGTDTTNPVLASALTAETTAKTTHTTPTLANSSGTSWLVSFWSEKSSTTTGSWTPPPSQMQRDLVVGDAGAHISSLLMDSGASVPTGTVGGLIATGASKTVSDLMGSLLLKPGS